jgi:vacuolar-type H+-ATPase subunit I/STV1
MSEKPTFLSEMQHAHQLLHKELDQLEEMILPLSSHSASEISSFLEKVQHEVTEHFSLEEKDGYMSGVLQKRPDLEATINYLLEEHGRLAQSMEEILAMASAGDDLSLIRLKVKEWIRTIRHHESAENLLVLDASNFDIGVAD